MATVESQRRVVLTDEQVRGICEAAPAGPVEALVRLWLACGVDLAAMPDDGEPFRPWSVAIPRAQWAQIAEALARGDVQRGGLASAMLLLVNKGPSSFDTEA